MRLYLRLEVGGAAVVLVERSRSKFAAGIVHPRLSTGEIEALYEAGTPTGLKDYWGEPIMQMPEWSSYAKERKRFDAMCTALASGKTKIQLAP